MKERSSNLLDLLATYMAWIHKEDDWKAAYTELDGDNNPSYYGWEVQNRVPIFGSIPKTQFNKKIAKLSFTDWLDLQCSNGWEVLKISRDFQSAHSHTWVVFRKQV